MKVKTLGWLVVAGALASSFVSCTQPKVECTAAHAGAFYGFAAKYTPTGTPPACAPAESLLLGDTIGFETYHPSKDDGDGPQADYSSTLVAIQADTLGFLALLAQDGLDKDGNPAPGNDPNPDHKLYASGNFDSTEPDANDFCKLTKLQPAEQNFSEYYAEVVDDTTDPPTVTYELAAPKTDIKYEWKNVDVYVTATSQGTQFSADLTHTQDACSVDYRVVGVWPGVGCLLDFDEMGNPIFQDSLCCPDADPNDDNRPVGSGINPDFPVVCDHNLGMCVL